MFLQNLLAPLGKIRVKYVLLLFGLICLSVVPAANVLASEEPPLPDLEVFAPVTPPTEPTEVQIGLYMIALDRVSAPSDASPQFEVEMFMDLHVHGSSMER